jgi:hypothetical protein
VAPHALRSKYLQRDLSLFNRSDLSRLLRRRFEPPAGRNVAT